MLNQDRLGLIADLDFLRPVSTHPDPDMALPQECYILLPVGLQACGRCGQTREGTLVLGIPHLVVCARCGPAEVAAIAIEGSFDFASDDLEWIAGD